MFNLNIKETSLKTLGLVCIIALWHLSSQSYPSIIIPSIIETFNRLYAILWLENGTSQIGITILRAFVGFILAVFFGIIFGILSATYTGFEYFMFPIERFMISVPPIAWIVLTLIWFGGDGIVSPAVTIFIAEFPLIYLSTVQAVKTLDTDLFNMAKSYDMPYPKALFHIGTMHIVSAIAPAITMVFGTSWKVAIMAEVLGAPNGIGAEIANARVNMETADVFSWILIVVFLYLILDKVLIKPINIYTMKWR